MLRIRLLQIRTAATGIARSLSANFRQLCSTVLTEDASS